MHVSSEHEKLPLDAAPRRRRASFAKLEQAVAELLNDSETRNMTHVIESLFAKRLVSRRHSTSVSNVSMNCIKVVGRRRHSLVDKNKLL